METQTVATERSVFEGLAQLRDELRLQIHLASAEARTEWHERLEPKWRELGPKLEALEKASAETGKELSAAVGLLIDELVEGYERLRKAL